MGDTQLTRRPGRALAAVTAALRGDAHALPDDPQRWSGFLALAAAHDLLPAVWSAQWRGAGLTMTPAVADLLEREAPVDRVVPEAVLWRAYDRNAARVARLLDHGVG